MQYNYQDHSFSANRNAKRSFFFSGEEEGQKSVPTNPINDTLFEEGSASPLTLVQQASRQQAESTLRRVKLLNNVDAEPHNPGLFDIEVMVENEPADTSKDDHNYAYWMDTDQYDRTPNFVEGQYKFDQEAVICTEEEFDDFESECTTSKSSSIVVSSDDKADNRSVVLGISSE